jgi:hypothetical protein
MALAWGVRASVITVHIFFFILGRLPRSMRNYVLRAGGIIVVEIFGIWFWAQFGYFVQDAVEKGVFLGAVLRVSVALVMVLIGLVKVLVGLVKFLVALVMVLLAMVELWSLIGGLPTLW